MMTKKPSRAVPKLMFPLTLAGILMLAMTPAQAEVYKWIDSNNEVQYTQMPPPEGVESLRIESTPPPAPEPTEGGTGLEKRLQTSDEQKQQKAEASADAELQAEIARISKQNCVTARNNLEQLNRSGQIRYRTGEGEVLRLSEDDRKQRIEEAGNQVKEFCKD
jgi:hypothetical protein